MSTLRVQGLGFKRSSGLEQRKTAHINDYRNCSDPRQMALSTGRGDLHPRGTPVQETVLGVWRQRRCCFDFIRGETSEEFL